MLKMDDPDLGERDQIFGPSIQCANCGYLSYSDFKYCARCGSKRHISSNQEVKTEITSDRNFISLISYFFITVGILAYSKFSEFSSDATLDFFILLGILAALDISYGIYNGKPSFLFSTKELRFNEVLKVLGVLTLGGFIVHFVADFLNASLFDEYVEVEYISSENWWLGILLISVYPAFFEEISFRGFLFHNVEQLSNKKAAIVVTSLIFGITHLSFISLIWHVPLGYYFAHLRAKHNTLWYGVIGHFFYNTLVTSIDLVM